MSKDQITADLEALIAEQFAGHVDEARALLLSYHDKETDRVRRAIVALSKGRIDRLAHNLQQALQDYRDVLYWAEYPDESQS